MYRYPDKNVLTLKYEWCLYSIILIGIVPNAYL